MTVCSSRLVLAACFLLSATLPVRSTTTNPAPNFQLTVVTDHPDAIYHQSEPVTFSIKLLRDSEPVSEGEVAWRISKDGVRPVTKGQVTLTNGRAVVAGTLEEPGFLQCSVSFTNSEGKLLSAVAGAAVAPLQIKPSLPVPDDFDAFWAQQKKKLAAVPVNPRLTSIKSPRKDVECFDLQADSVGAPVSGYFARPSGAKPGSLPIILTVHGAGVASSSLGSAAGWASRGFLALDLNAHGIPNGKPDDFYADLWKGELKEYYLRGRDSPDNFYFLGVFLRLIRALDFLTAQPEWDGRTVIVHGSSQGGAQSLAAAGLDSRVTFFAAGVPAMCDHTGMVADRISGWPKLVPKGSDGRPDTNVLQTARYYDCMNFARRTHAAGIVTVGFIDGVCPPTSVYAMYNTLMTKKEIFNDPLSGHHVGDEAGEAMKRAISAHVNSMRKEK